MGTEIHEELWHPGGHIVGTGQDTGAEPQDASVALHQVCKNRASTHITKENQQQPPSTAETSSSGEIQSSTDINLRTSRLGPLPYSESQMHSRIFNFLHLLPIGINLQLLDTI